MENNKLIAEFVCLDKGKYEILLPVFGWFDSRENELASTKGKPFSEIKFHSSWDWLMPVVEKIENTATDTYVEIREYSTEIWGYDFRINIYRETKIESVYKAVVEFIKWYNKNK